MRAAAVHPGGIQTELARHMEPDALKGLVEQMNSQLAAEGKEPFQFKTIPQGAATSVWAAVAAPADEIGGRYCENCHVGQIVADDVIISASSEGVRGYALDPKAAEALWKKSEELVGEALRNIYKTRRKRNASPNWSRGQFYTAGDIPDRESYGIRRHATCWSAGLGTAA